MMNCHSILKNIETVYTLMLPIKIYFGIIQENFILEIGHIKKVKVKNQVKEFNIYLKV
jgi:hypothetical protein